MKIFLSILVVSCLSLSCNKDEIIKGVIVDTLVDVSVIDESTNKDLLNPNEENHYDIANITFEFKAFFNGQASSAPLQYTQPFVLQKDGRFYLRLFPATTASMAEKYTITVHWPDTEKDVITFYLRRENPNIFTDKIMLNDELKWEKSKGYKEITILK